jgi:hypothetical protein
MKTARFVPFWSEGKDSFLSDPPNADISIIEGSEMRQVVATIEQPELKDGNLSYTVKVLEGELPATGADVSVFIDVIGHGRSLGLLGLEDLGLRCFGADRRVVLVSRPPLPGMPRPSAMSTAASRSTFRHRASLAVFSERLSIRASWERPADLKEVIHAGSSADARWEGSNRSSRTPNHTT